LLFKISHKFLAKISDPRSIQEECTLNYDFFLQKYLQENFKSSESLYSDKTPIHGGHYSWKLLEFILLLYRVKTEISKIISITEVQINLPHVYKKKV